MTDVTELAHGQINASGDSIAIELVEPTNNRSMIMSAGRTMQPSCNPPNTPQPPPRSRSWRTPAPATPKSGLKGDADWSDGGLGQTD
jgi:hypothetical protein